ncbi:MAG: phosphatase PAP2 family protein [Acidobacteria bacterium]|nr:phosphatase PAP2 family protein [Acidobacteriota bacterium]
MIPSHPWAVASLVYFAYLAAAAAVRTGLFTGARVRVWIGAAIGLAVSAIAASVTSFWLRDVLLPPVLLLTAYWTSGLSWVRPMPRVERWLGAFDRRLRVPEIAARLPRVLSGFFELAYVGVYPLIPIALMLELIGSARPDATRFWTVILITDYICFAMLPWIQTRPPRVLESGPYNSRLRAFNLALLGHASIGVNTVPSGHAAEGLAVALLLSDAHPGIAATMAFSAVAISAATVLGRYHYALDALAGWAVAIAVWHLV